ncbi:MAG TPA: ATP-binding protein [Allosphingosinicella sp.]|jgi:two-component system sensor kinase FixL
MQAEVPTRELLELISEGFVFVDAEFRVREINAAGLRMANRPAGDFIGRSLWDIAPQLKGSEMERICRQTMAERRPISAEHLHSWSDGRKSCLEIRLFPSGDGLAVFYRDVTDRKRSQQELDRAQAELVQSTQQSAIGTMAATLAHELAQPLTSTRSYVAAGRNLLRGVADPKAREARRALALALAAADRASETLKRLREFVLRGRLETEVDDLHAIIGEAGVLTLPQAQAAGAEIGFRLDRHARWVEADAVQVRQVLFNLIRNAIEAVRESETRRITIAAAPAGAGLIEVAVEDSGPGLALPPETLFAPFRSTKAEGLGVGLSLSRTIVEAHGGTLTAANLDGGGASFRFTLPRAAAPN